MAWGDYDNDGYLDLAFTGTDTTLGRSLPGFTTTTAIAFSDSGISLPNVAGGSLNWADYDNDGNLDLCSPAGQ